MSCHTLSCVILGSPAAEICLLFLHQSVMPPDGKGRGCYVRGGVWHRNTPPDELCYHRCVQAKTSLDTSCSTEVEPVIHVCRVWLYCSVHPTVTGIGKHLDGRGGITFSTSTKNPWRKAGQVIGHVPIATGSSCPKSVCETFCCSNSWDADL